MKKHVLLLSFYLFAGLVNAQYNKELMFPKNAKYFIKDGPEVPYDKIDSVVISWGGTFGKMISSEAGEEKIYLVPPGLANEKREKKLIEKANGMVGKVAPDFELTDIHGKKYQLKDLKEKVVVLNFWFTACVPCITEMPELNSVQEKYKDQEVIFLALGRDETETIKGFLKNHVFNYTLLADAVQTSEAYNVSVYPTSMVIDKAGVIRYVQVTGKDITESLSREIKKLL